MWTPKRVWLLIGSFAVFFIAYQGYAALLGGIDGLTPLPQVYWPVPYDPSTLPPITATVNLADRKLQQAFGSACPELERTNKFELRKRGLVIAVDSFNPGPDGQVELRPFSIAVFGKTQANGPAPEINTISSKVAYLTFEKPVKNIPDMANNKIIGAELRDDIWIVNNRRTPQRDDDLIVHTQGPLFFDDIQHRVWTAKEVELTDSKSKPEPIKVQAIGMDLYLTADSAKSNSGPSSPKKPKNDTMGGVERVELRKDVRMDLFVDSRSGFLSAAKPADKTKKPAPATPSSPTAPEMTKVIITTAGKFTYDVNTDHARFEIPHRQSQYEEKVEVKRLHPQEKTDDLKCDRLDLQFRKKSPQEATAPPPDDRSANLEIESAHAVGHLVSLESSSEGLNAFGNDFFYDAGKHQTILKGIPEMVAMKDGNEIYAPELVMESNEKRDAQEVLAKGPGRIRMLDRSTGQRNQQANWMEQLQYKKDGVYDCLTLTGTASFLDKEHDQVMRADRLKVWFEPAGPPNPDKQKPPDEQPEQHLRPHHIEAKGRVTADSPDIRVKEPTDHLLIWFKDVPPAALAPTVAQEPIKTALPAGSDYLTEKAITPSVSSVDAGPATGSTLAPVGPARKAKPPIELSANSVVVHILRADNKNELDQLECSGAVNVHQDPATPEERGVDIHGDTLVLNHHADGGILVVNGSPGHVQLDKIAILGPEVNIDQCSNKAWVNGIGAMQMLTESNLDGVKLAKPTELTIHWRDSMLFTGKDAQFRGGVQAEQLNSRLLCQDLQVDFDRPISLKEGDKGKEKAKVDHLVCDKSVQIEEINKENGALKDYKRLVAPEVNFDNLAGKVNAAGPGEVRILQLGSAENNFPQINASGQRSATPASAPKKAEKQELKLTHIKYTEGMQANNIQRTAHFYGNVQLVNGPADLPDIVIDVDHLQPGWLFLRCGNLDVVSRLLPDGKTKSQEMEAHNKVFIQSQEFYGNADTVKFDESQDRVIFEAVEGGLVTLYRVKFLGGQHEKITGKKIYYWRKTNDFKVEGSRGMNVAN